MNSLPSYSKKILTEVQSMAPQINTVAAKYVVPAEAIAGSLAQELLDRTASYWNEARAVGSSFHAYKSLADAYAAGVAMNPLNPERGASDYILNRYNVAPNAITVGSDIPKSFAVIDFGPAGVKFHNAIQAIQPMRYLPPSMFGLPSASSANSNLTDWLADLLGARPRQ
ncbi:hypothetical protein ACVIGA_001533 [Bradyrhizobium sp. USDA 3240]